MLNIINTINLPMSITFYDDKGSLVYGTTQSLIDLSGLSSGIYIAEIKAGDVVVRKRWVKM